MYRLPFLFAIESRFAYIDRLYPAFELRRDRELAGWCRSQAAIDRGFEVFEALQDRVARGIGGLDADNGQCVFAGQAADEFRRLRFQRQQAPR